MEIINPKEFRNNVRGEFYKFIKNKTISKSIEDSIYNYTYKYCKKNKIVCKWQNEKFILIYKHRFKDLYSNLNPKFTTFNRDFYNDVKNSNKKGNENILKKLDSITHQEMNFSLWSPLIDKRLKMDKERQEGGMSAATDEFFCNKCKQRKCVYTQVQIRSADEPMTTFVNCLNCGNNFRIN